MPTDDVTMHYIIISKKNLSKDLITSKQNHLMLLCGLDNHIEATNKFLTGTIPGTSIQVAFICLSIVTT